jgi:hypothetical protein
VVKRIKAKEAKKQATEGQSLSPSSSSGSADYNQDEPSTTFPPVEVVGQDTSPLSVAFSLTQDLEDRAIGIFVYNYVYDPTGPSSGHLDQVTDLHRSLGLEDCLLTAMKAVGLASYAHKACAPSLLLNARYQYTKAIRLTNAALQSSDDVTKDSTLMAVQILGVFEQVTGCGQKSIQNWIEHVLGASAVMKLRGKGQTETPAGRRMLVSVTSNLLIRCVYGKMRLPAHLREYMDLARKHASHMSTGLNVQGVMVLLADLRADIEEGILKSQVDIVLRARELDNTLLQLAESAPTDWAYDEILTDADSDIIYNGKYHVYYNLWMGYMWNALRTQRILIHQIIRDALSAGVTSFPPVFTNEYYITQYNLVSKTLLSVQEDILSSVPQHIGVGEPPRSIANAKESYMVPISGGMFLMWPLWLAGIPDGTALPIRNFVSRTLHSIGDNQGIQQAHVFAGIIERSGNIDVWERKTINGVPK